MIYDREKTLFVTDMDGTLLNTDSQLSPYTVEVLREVLSRGFNLTVASGRMPESPVEIFRNAGLELRLPVIGRNGVLVFDPIADKYIKIHTLPSFSSEKIIWLIRENKAQMFLFERAQNGKPVFNRRGMEGFEQSLNDFNDIIYITADGSRAQLQLIYDNSTILPDTGGLLFRDDFFSTDPDLWFAEFFSADAGKGNGIRFIMERYGFTSAVCFGDNLNDLSMFEVCDEGYAPENAASEVQAAASAVIGANSADGVARWLEEKLLS